jgi:hypothetical protein
MDRVKVAAELVRLAKSLVAWTGTNWPDVGKFPDEYYTNGKWMVVVSHGGKGTSILGRDGDLYVGGVNIRYFDSKGAAARAAKGLIPSSEESLGGRASIWVVPWVWRFSHFARRPTPADEKKRKTLIPIQKKDMDGEKVWEGTW